MTLQDLEHIAAAGESETVEFKKSTAQLTRAGETLSAFLNCQGGRVFIGVTPEGRVVGQQILHRHLPISGRFEAGRLERIDELLLPTAALREALVNALCHRDYAIHGGAVNVAVYDDRTEIWSDGTLPFGLRPEDLKREHTSHPRNPFVTDVFYRRGLIEQWGRGTQKIVELCVRAGHPEPEFGEQAGSVFVRFRLLRRAVAAPITGHVAGQVAGHVAGQVSSEVRRLLQRVETESTRTEIQSRLGLRGRANFEERYLKPALALGLLEMTHPEKRRSRLQEYRLSDKGRAWLAAQAK
jgi:predicted HTH transcriptional regulator